MFIDAQDCFVVFEYHTSLASVAVSFGLEVLDAFGCVGGNGLMNKAPVLLQKRLHLGPVFCSLPVVVVPIVGFGSSINVVEEQEKAEQEDPDAAPHP
jgi:hypothetical protein